MLILFVQIMIKNSYKKFMFFFCKIFLYNLNLFKIHIIKLEAYKKKITNLTGARKRK